MEVLFPLASAFLLTLAAAPLTIWFAKRYGLVDNPATRPHPAHVQQRIIPRAGGLAIYIGIVASILLFVPIEKNILGIILSLTLLLVTGLLDDKLHNFSPYLRLGLQILAAIIVVASGVGISFVTNPLGGILRLDEILIPVNFFGQHNIILIADLIAFVWIVGVMNIVNWSKGVDGQMPGIIFVAAITIALLSYKLFLQGDPNQLHISSLSFIVAGASLGFLVFNWYPAKIIPGFGGSTILGFMIATLSIMSSAKFATALLVLLIPTVDFIFIFWRRVLTGQSPVWGDAGHLHHKLLALGWSHRQISLFYIITGAILGLAATTLPSQEKIITMIVVGFTTMSIITWLHFFTNQPKN